MDGVNGEPAEPAIARAPVAGTATQTIYCGDNLDKLKTRVDLAVFCSLRDGLGQTIQRWAAFERGRA